MKRSVLENGGIVLGGGNFPIPVALTLRVGTEGPDKKKGVKRVGRKKKNSDNRRRTGKEKCNGDECGEQ